jgi:Chemoreceptor zinc-binding domain
LPVASEPSVMNFQEARDQHAEWRAKFRAAIATRQPLDAAAIGQDDQCILGKWLHGEAKAVYGRFPGYVDCVEKHATFHKEAFRVAKAINESRYDEARRLFEIGTAYSAASAAVGWALSTLERDTQAGG